MILQAPSVRKDYKIVGLASQHGVTRSLILQAPSVTMGLHDHESCKPPWNCEITDLASQHGVARTWILHASLELQDHGYCTPAWSCKHMNLASHSGVARSLYWVARSWLSKLLLSAWRCIVETLYICWYIYLSIYI